MILLRRGSPLVIKIMASIILASVFFLTLLSIVVYYTNETLEFDFLAKQTDSELRNLQHLLALDPQAPLPKSAGRSIYLASRQPGQPIPAHLLKLQDGEYHNVKLGTKAFHILIAKHSDDRIYIQYDITEIERSEELLTLILFIAWIAMIIAIFIVARILSRKLSGPVTRLSQELSHISPDQRYVQLSGQFEDDEVGKIAQAFDSYTEKMDDYVEKQIAFTMMASHELRSPLSIVQSSCDLIACQQKDPKVAIHLKEIQRSSTDMANMIHALLAVTLDKPTRHIDESFKLRQLIDEIITIANDKILAKQIQIKNCLDQELSLKADKILATVVLSNLIGNAINHSQQGSIKIETKADSLSIIDNGIGIDVEQLRQISDFGFQGQDGEVYGIGVYISKLICDHQNWSLKLEQNALGGTTSIIEFPSLSMNLYIE